MSLVFQVFATQLRPKDNYFVFGATSTTQAEKLSKLAINEALGRIRTAFVDPPPVVRMIPDFSTFYPDIMTPNGRCVLCVKKGVTETIWPHHSRPTQPSGPPKHKQEVLLR